jgi:inner membrane protein involved in colicin E2 resistance
MIKRIAALAFIFGCTTVAWIILGSTIFARTYDYQSGLRTRVESNWGTAQSQKPPAASYDVTTTETVEEYREGKTTRKQVATTNAVPFPVVLSDIDVAFDLEHRQKGLLWYSTYKVTFGGTYNIRNNSAREQLVTFRFPLPAAQAIYDDLVFTLNGSAVQTQNQNNHVVGTLRVPGGKDAELHVGYRSQGLDSWNYYFGDEVAQVQNFNLTMKTNFKDIDFPEKTLSPTSKQETAEGWNLNWNYKNLISGFAIGMDMPDKLQPGPLAGQISYFAPVSLFFFFFLMFIITTLRGINLHPMNYFFLAAAFFAFHLLLAYLVDHVSIHLAFLICSAVSIFLVISYLRLVVGLRFAAVEAGLAQFVYLVLFSYAFFFKGFTGLSVTIGAIVTLFVVMQMTGRINWEERFARATA